MYDYTWGMLSPWQKQEILEKEEDDERMAEEKQKVGDMLKETMGKVPLTSDTVKNIDRKPGARLTYRAPPRGRSTIKFPVLA